MSNEKLQVKYTPFEISEVDPPLTIYGVELSTPEGVWRESLPSAESLEVFLRGVRAASEMLGHFPDIPEVPQKLF